MEIPVALREISRCIDRENDDDHVFDDKRDVAAVVIAIMIMRLYICLHSSLSRDRRKKKGGSWPIRLSKYGSNKNNKRKQVVIRS